MSGHGTGGEQPKHSVECEEIAVDPKPLGASACQVGKRRNTLHLVLIANVNFDLGPVDTHQAEPH